MFENKDEITLNEFKAWLVGLIRGKNGKLPDLEDWKLIKEMLDKVVSEKEVIAIKENNDPFSPWTSPTEPYKYYPYIGDPLPGHSPIVWWNDSTKDTITYSGTSTTPNTSDNKFEIDTNALLDLVKEWEHNG